MSPDSDVAGLALGYAIAAWKVLELIRDWRGGSPELRTIRETIARQDANWARISGTMDSQTEALVKIAEGLEARKRV